MTGIFAAHLFDGQPALVAGDVGIMDAESSGCLVLHKPGQTRTKMTAF